MRIYKKGGEGYAAIFMRKMAAYSHRLVRELPSKPAIILSAHTVMIADPQMAYYVAYRSGAYCDT
jgi:hypothetical protein